MEQRRREYTVGELARASGVRVSLLHHYDRIGLLKPGAKAANGYRIYFEEQAVKLQEILFYRAAGMSLEEIATLFEQGVSLERLKAHRKKLVMDLASQAAMIAAIDHSIAHLKGSKSMKLEELYQPFSLQKQASYEKWLIDTYGADMALEIQEVRAHNRQQTEGAKPQGLERLRGIEAALVANYEEGMQPQAANLLGHQQWVGDMWGRECDRQAYGELAELYLSHPDFIARFESLSQGFSQWLYEAMKAWSTRLPK
ncbi:MerR family transcriptional regulator [Polycladidibacter stylochi]|uniref:MerR family transcriptional regulator n=1 Tax=Polycladidibacter stylochi TaxID=1807766 RepID=UPI0008356B1A|nr:MerR family transcriptional regulator [Pseudovibrio stylochi]